MTKEELTEKYFIIEVIDESEKTTDFLGWKVIANVGESTAWSSPEYKTDPEAWPIMFRLKYQNGLLLASPECPEQYYVDNDELQEMVKDISATQNLTEQLNQYIKGFDESALINDLIYREPQRLITPDWSSITTPICVDDTILGTSITCSSTCDAGITTATATTAAKAAHYNTYANYAADFISSSRIC
ncbi:MAG: hypothetical protein J6I84_03310 [Bacilli bacterium]|nr:hypothetical protein [Bacilli bacterium]